MAESEERPIAPGTEPGQQPTYGPPAHAVTYAAPPLAPPPATAQVAVTQPGGFKRGFGLGMGLALGLGVVGLVASIVTTLIAFGSISAMVASSGGGMATTNTYTMWGDSSATTQVRVLSINGAILADESDGMLLTGGTYGYELASMIDDVADEDAEAIVLMVNTPGGSVAGSQAIADAVQRYQDETGKPVFAHVSSMSASGGVYSTATATKIFADHGALVGSIGITSGPFYHYDSVVEITGSLLESGVATTGGITAETLSQGRSKDFGSPWRAMTEEERTHWLDSLNTSYDAFVNHVAEHRGIAADVIVDEMGALIFDTQAAQEYGLIDDVVTRADFFSVVAEELGVNPDDLRFEATATPSPLEALLGAERSYGTSWPAPQAEGTTPVVSQSFCASITPLAFDGDMRAVCGG